MNFSKKYGIVLSFQQSKLRFNFIKIQKDADIREDFLNFSKEEKKIFTLIQNKEKWKQEVDDQEILDLLIKVSFQIYFKDNQIFKLIQNNNQIKLNAFLKKIDEDDFPEKVNDIVFEIEPEEILFMKTGIDSIYIFTKKTFYVIKNEDKMIFNLIKRAVLKRYSFYDEKIFARKYQTNLSNLEVLNINEIKKKLEIIFNLNTFFKEEIEFQEIKDKEGILEVEYVYKEYFLEIKPYFDYKIKKVPLFEAIKIVKNKVEFEFKRKFNQEYGIDYFIEFDKEKTNKIFWTKIDLDKELDFYKYLFAFKSELNLGKNLILKRKGLRQVKRFLNNGWDKFKILPYKKVYLKDKIDFEKQKFRADIDFNLKNNSDVELKVDLYLGQKKINYTELKKYFNQNIFKKNKKDFTIQQDDGSLISVENQEELTKILDILKKFEQKEGEIFEGKLYQIGSELTDIFNNSEYYKTKIDKGFDDFLKDLKEKKGNKWIFDNKKDIDNPNKKTEYEIPEKYQKILRDYQKAGINWMTFLKKYHFGGILADDMGLGKTIQTLIFLDINKQKEKPSIVVAPKTLLKNWYLEARKFVPDLKVLMMDGTQKERLEKIEEIYNYDLVLISYSLLQRDIDFIKGKGLKFNYVILDEAQYVKNFRTKNAIAVKDIDSDYRLALSGTPLENSVSEIWSIFEFLMPGFLGTQSDFSKKYIIPISNGDKKKLKELSQKISFFMLRRLKKDVLKELPPKIEQNIFVDLNLEQKVIYKEILEKMKNKFGALNFEEFKKSYIHILAILTKLRQVCNHPNLLFKEKDYKKYSSEKLEVFKNLIQEIVAENRKVLVFSQFTKMLDILESELKNQEIDYLRLDGKTQNRLNVIDNFNREKKVKVFLISLKAGGVGLNLTSADSVIIFDPWWNPSVENQAIDRAYRIGQKKSVNVYKIITKNTIEEKILDLQKDKKNLFDNLIDKNKSLDLKKMKWEDFKKIFDF